MNKFFKSIVVGMALGICFITIPVMAESLESQITILETQIQSEQWEIKYLQMRYSFLLTDITRKQTKIRSLQAQVKKAHIDKMKKEKIEKEAKPETEVKIAPPEVPKGE